MTKARPRAEGDTAHPYSTGPSPNPAAPHQPIAQPRARLPPRRGQGRARPGQEETQAPPQPKMTSAVYYSYTNGPSHRLGAIPGMSRDEQSRTPFPPFSPHPPPPVTSSHTLQAESPSIEDRAQVPFAWRGIALRHDGPPPGTANRAAGKVKLNRQAQGLPGGLGRGPRVLAKV